MPPVTSKVLVQSLSKRLANFKISDAVIKKFADRVIIDGLDIKRFDICIYGICIDYHTDKIPRLDAFLKYADVSKFEVFPYGIIDWDHFHIRVGFNVDELAGRVNVPGNF